METGLKGRVALVTGAAGTIGSAVCRSLAEEGAKLIIHYRSKGEDAKRLAKELGAECVVKADLTDEPQVAKLFKQAEKEVGPVEVFVGNAGIWEEKPVPLVDMPLSQWYRTLTTNLTSQFLGLREFLRGVRRAELQDPSAVLIGSTAGVYGEADHADYAASKAGATYGLLLSVKNEIARLAPLGRVNAVCPGWVITPMAGDAIQDKKAVTRIVQTIALRKIAKPEDVAAAVVYLASPVLSGHVSGQTIVVAGGMEGRVLYSPNEIDFKKAVTPL